MTGIRHHTEFVIEPIFFEKLFIFLVDCAIIN